MEKPAMVLNDWTSGVAARIASILRHTSAVRSREEASGSWTFMKK